MKEKPISADYFSQRIYTRAVTISPSTSTDYAAMTSPSDRRDSFAYRVDEGGKNERRKETLIIEREFPVVDSNCQNCDKRSSDLTAIWLFSLCSRIHIYLTADQPIAARLIYETIQQSVCVCVCPSRVAMKGKNCSTRRRRGS